MGGRAPEGRVLSRREPCFYSILLVLSTVTASWGAGGGAMGFAHSRQALYYPSYLVSHLFLRHVFCNSWPSLPALFLLVYRCVATLTRQSFLQPSRWGFCQLLVSGAALCKTGIEVGGPCSPRHKTLPLENKTKHPNKLHGLAQKALVASAALSVTFLSIFLGLFYICHQRWALVYLFILEIMLV